MVPLQKRIVKVGKSFIPLRSKEVIAANGAGNKTLIAWGRGKLTNE